MSQTLSRLAGAAQQPPESPQDSRQGVIGIRHLKKFNNPASFHKAFRPPARAACEKGTLLR